MFNNGFRPEVVWVDAAPGRAAFVFFYSDQKAGKAGHLNGSTFA